MMSSGPQPSTSISSTGYNNMLRGIGRDSNSMHSAKAGSNQPGGNGNHVYPMSQSNNTAVALINSGEGLGTN